MTPTILILILGFAVLLAGAGLLGTLLGVRATLASFSNVETGVIMAGYYAGYILGTRLTPRIIRNVGHIRTFAALAAIVAAACLTYGLVVAPLPWLALRLVNGACIVGLYMVVESWLNAQCTGPVRGRVFAVYMMSTLAALGAGQFLLPLADSADLTLFVIAAILIAIGLVPVAVTRVTEPRIETDAPVHLIELLRISPLGVVGTLCSGIVGGAFWGMTAVFGGRLNLAEQDIATLISATILGGAILQWPIGHLSDRYDRRRVLILTSVAVAVVAAVSAFIVMRDLPGLVVSAFVYGGLMFALYSISVAHTNDHLEREQVLEATRGLLLVYGLGALSGPLLVGVAMDMLGPVGLPLVSTAGATLLALYGLYRTTRRAPPPTEEQSDFVPMVRTTPVALEMYPQADPETSAPETGKPSDPEPGTPARHPGC
ncbi:MAG: MFS transporter [Chromatiales bacterium]|jgi:MFS family permease